MRFEEEIERHNQARIDLIEKSIEYPWHLLENRFEKSIDDEDNLIKSLNTIIESFLSNSISEDILMKAMAGVYSDTPENKKLGRVGQKYGSQGEEDKESSKQGGDKQKVTGVDFKHLERFNLNEDYVNSLIPHMTKNIDATKKFIQNLDKLADKLSEKKDNTSYNEAKNLRNLKVYLLHQMFK